jgi:Glycine zipper
MNRLLFPMVALAVFAVPTNSVFAQFRSSGTSQQRGVVAGGLTGAVIGGLIGDHNDEAGAGAAIGGVVGAVAGGMFGNAADKDRQAAQQQRYYQAQQQRVYAAEQHAVVTQGAVSMTDVISMSKSGLSDNLIINQIQSRGVRQTLQVSDIIHLHQQGVSEHVISMMQTAPVGAQTVTVSRPTEVYVPAQPVVVEEHYVVPHYAPPRVHYYGPSHRHVHYGH